MGVLIPRGVDNFFREKPLRDMGETAFLKSYPFIHRPNNNKYLIYKLSTGLTRFSDAYGKLGKQHRNSFKNREKNERHRDRPKRHSPTRPNEGSDRQKPRERRHHAKRFVVSQLRMRARSAEMQAVLSNCGLRIPGDVFGMVKPLPKSGAKNYLSGADARYRSPC